MAKPDLIDLIDRGYALDADPRDRYQGLAETHDAHFAFPDGSFLMPYHFDRATGALSVDSERIVFARMDPAKLEVLSEVQRSTRAYPAQSPRFYGGIQAATMSERLRELPAAAPFIGSVRPAYERLGIADFHVLCATNLDGHGMLLGAVTRRELSLRASERRKLQAVASHLAAGHRLARALGPGVESPGAAEAVLEPSGKIAHARGPARPASARERLRHAVAFRERAHTRALRRDPEAALGAWPSLVAGRWTLLDHYDSDGRRYLIARENEPRAAELRALTRRERQVVARAAEGHANKLIAYELGLATGTVAVHLRNGMRKLGVSSRVALAGVYRTALAAEAEELDVGGEALRVARAPEAALPTELTPAEAETLSLLRRGATNADIAAARGVRPKTVENQLARLYRKLGVFSRAELIARHG